ncbi:MAG: riboflavin synthase [Syntrophobacteraceae bacterium]|nr:riboflavin synthase [Syntrophobacteraceae bacterium]
MFTGLIEGTGTLLRTERHGPDARMVISPGFQMDKPVLGESIAVDGACLTVVDFDSSSFVADVSAETLAKTTLGAKASGSRVNLERALRLGDRLGGHLVTGHIDGIGRLKERKAEGRSIRISFELARESMRFVIEKGSIAINGISLTVNGVESSGFDVNVIPHTASMTTLCDLQIGSQVNIETDLIGKYLHRLVSLREGPAEQNPGGKGIDLDLLRRHGFA